MLGTTQVLDKLREEGYEVSHSYIAYLLRERVIRVPEKGPGGVLLWSDADVARLEAELAHRKRGPEA